MAKVERRALAATLKKSRQAKEVRKTEQETKQMIHLLLTIIFITTSIAYIVYKVNT